MKLEFGAYLGFGICGLGFQTLCPLFFALRDTRERFSIPAAKRGISSSKTVLMSRINSSLLIRAMIGGSPFLKVSSRLFTEKSSGLTATTDGWKFLKGKGSTAHLRDIFSQENVILSFVLPANLFSNRFPLLVSFFVSKRQHPERRNFFHGPLLIEVEEEGRFESGQGELVDAEGPGQED